MKRCSIIALFFCLPYNVVSQKAGLITLDALQSRLSKGLDTTYIINFWATWCGPCIKELPYFDELNRNFKAGKLKVLLINVDFKSKLNAVVIPFLKKTKTQSEVFVLNEKNQQEYIDRVDKNWSGAIPATLFVHQNKRRFFEKDFTYSELLKEYQNFK